jgi:glycosyltransferase involved in cell wall biosynthesis
MELSVIIPVYNAGPVFEECLSALAGSSLTPDEIIIIDDCSNPKVLEPSLSIPIKVIRSETPLGAGMARNLGVSSAKGRILLFIDSDVLVAENTIFSVMQRFKADKELSALSGFYDYRNRYTNQASIYNNLYFEYKQSHIKPDTPYADTAIWAVRKEVFLSSGGFALGLYSSEDLELAIKLKSLGYKLQTDRSIRVTHVKYLSFKSWIKNRVTASANMFMARLRRPSYKREAQHRNAESSLFATILPAQIISPFIAWGIICAMSLLAILKQPMFCFFSLILLLLYFLINMNYIRFIVKRRQLLSIQLLPYIFLEHLITLISAVVAIVRVVFKRSYVLYRRNNSE